jgi:hypothetical protein
LDLILDLSNSDGAVAQLGERLLCKQEVTGSIPVSSTNTTLQRCCLMLGVNRDTVIILFNGKLVSRFWRRTLSRSGEQWLFNSILR